MTSSDSLGQAKTQALQQRHRDLLEEYQAANAQLSRALSDVDRLRIQRTVRDLEHEIAQIEAELRLLSAADGATPTAGSVSRPEPDIPTDASWASLRQHPELLAGQTLLSYHLVEFIGAGGSGLVYRGWQPTLGRSIAFKLFYPLASSYKALYGAFEHGFRALGALEHPNIIRIFDVGRVIVAGEDTFYIVMEYVDGVPLDRWSATLGEGPDVFGQRLAAAVALAEALDAAHNTTYVDEVGFQTRGVLHGDLKPANVLVSRTDTVKLGDFLLVDVQRLLDPRIISPRALRGKRAVTEAYGTPGFMAPEQERRGIVTITTDVYGLGMTLCHLFQPSSRYPCMELLASSEHPILADLKGLVTRMVAERAEDRPSSVSQVLIALKAIRDGSTNKPSLLKRLRRLTGTATS